MKTATHKKLRSINVTLAGLDGVFVTFLRSPEAKLVTWQELYQSQSNGPEDAQLAATYAEVRRQARVLINEQGEDGPVLAGYYDADRGHWWVEIWDHRTNQMRIIIEAPHRHRDGKATLESCRAACKMVKSNFNLFMA